MRSALSLLFALAACSSQPPSGPSPAPTPAPPPAPRSLPFSGAYELSVSIAAECAREFPVAARVRNWDVRILDAGDRSLLDFEDADVADSIGNGPDFSSQAVLVAPGSARLTLHFDELLGYSRGDRGDPQIYRVEGVSSVPGGDAVPIRGASLEGTLAARIDYDGGPGARARCTSERHDFYLRPR